jgi:hypothetical protein
MTCINNEFLYISIINCPINNPSWHIRSLTSDFRLVHYVRDEILALAGLICAAVPTSPDMTVYREGPFRQRQNGRAFFCGDQDLSYCLHNSTDLYGHSSRFHSHFNISTVSFFRNTSYVLCRVLEIRQGNRRVLLGTWPIRLSMQLIRKMVDMNL